MDTVLSKEEIFRRIKIMRTNRKRGFSMRQFAQFAAIEYRHFESVIRDRKDTFTELTQRKLSKALMSLEKGEAGPRVDILGKKFIGYHSKPKPVLKRTVGLEIGESGFKLKVGLRNKYDFSTPRLDDAMKKRG